MFTGLIEEVGKVRSARDSRLDIECSLELAAGESVAVNGVCLTAAEVTSSGFGSDLSAETLGRTTLGSFRGGEVVNLERPVQVSGRLGGHIVQGHVDGKGILTSLASPDGKPGFADAIIELPAELLRYVVEKGSIAVDGISLAVSDLTETGVKVALIPETLRRTTLGSAREGDEVNIEVDLVAKYVERLLRWRELQPEGHPE